MITKFFIYTTIFFLFLFGCNTKEEAVSTQAKDLEDVKVDEKPMPIKQVNPEYPDSARRNNIEGIVLVKALLAEDGTIKEVKVKKNESGSTLLARAAMKAALDWEFKPATVNQKPIQVYLTIPFRFKVFQQKVENNTVYGIPKQDEDFAPVDEQPIPIKQVQPQYPELARRAGVEGTVWLKVRVSVEGKVKEVKVMNLSSNSKNGDTPGGLQQAAMEAARQYIFKPAMKNNKPVEVWVAMPFIFKLKEDGKKK